MRRIYTDAFILLYLHIDIMGSFILLKRSKYKKRCHVLCDRGFSPDRSALTLIPGLYRLREKALLAPEQFVLAKSNYGIAF